MRFVRQFVRGRTIAHRATSALLCCAYAMAALGVPLPAPTVYESAAMPYPCQHGRCGCRTAEQCWKSCCCKTNREKLAWARAHGVTPPTYVVVAAEREAASPAPRSCCAKRGERGQGSGVSDRKSEQEKLTPRPSTLAPITWTSAFEVRRCRGESTTWLNVANSIPPPAPIRTTSFDICVRPLPAVAALIWIAPSFTPPDPPPWIV